MFLTPCVALCSKTPLQKNCTRLPESLRNKKKELKKEGKAPRTLPVSIIVVFVSFYCDVFYFDPVFVIILPANHTTLGLLILFFFSLCEGTFKPVWFFYINKMWMWVLKRRRERIQKGSDLKKKTKKKKNKRGQSLFFLCVLNLFSRESLICKPVTCAFL